MSSTLQSSSNELTQFVERSLTTIIQTTAQDKFTAAFNAFFSNKLSVTVNGQHLNREQFLQQFQEEHNFASELTVKFNSIVVLTDANVPGLKDSAAVGVSYTVTIDSKFIILGSPEVRFLNVSLNLIISNEGDAPHRRVVDVNEVSATTTPPIVLPGDNKP